MALESPIFLFALFGLAIPVVLHIWGINVFKKVYLSSVELLRSIKLETNRTDRIRKWLLLLARCCLLLFLVFSFAQPFIAKKNGVTSLGKEKRDVFFDRSASACSDDGARIFSDVQKSFPSLERREGNAYDDFSECPQSSKKLSEVVAGASSVNDLYVFSDFQKSFVDTEELLSTGGDLYLINMGRKQALPNISVDSVWLSENYIRYNTSATLNVLLRNNGEEENKNVLCELKVGQKSVASNMLIMAPNSIKRLEFPIVLQKEEDKFCTIKLDDGSWTFDNQFYFVLNPIESLRVAVVSDSWFSNHPAKIAFDQESIFQCDVVKELGRGADVLDAASLLVANQTETVEQSEFALLIELAKKGKTVVVIPSAKWGIKEVEAINTELGKAIIGQKLSEVEEIDIPDIHHPFFKNIFELLPSSSNMPSVKPLWKINNPSETILKTKSGDIALASEEVGMGRMYFFSFGLGESESFSRNAIFLPIFYRIAENSAKNSTKSYCRVTDEIVDFASKENLGKQDRVYSLENDDYKIIPEQRLQGDKVRFFLSEDQMPLGIWHVKDKEGVDVVQFGLNNDKNESKMDFYSVDELEQKYTKNPKVKVMTLDEFKKDVDELGVNKSEWPLWRYAIVISFLFLLAEILIVRYYKNSFRLQSKTQ